MINNNRKITMLHKDDAPLILDLYRLQAINFLLDANSQRLKLLNILMTVYQEELLPGHEPNWYDFKKERHKQKVTMAVLLKNACQKPITNLMELANLNSLVEELKTKNLEIDANGNRFGDILKTYDSNNLDIKMYDLIHSKRNVANYMLIILQHLIAIAQEEKKTNRDHHSRSNVLYTQSKAYNHHQAQIITFKNLIQEMIIDLSRPIVSDTVHHALKQYAEGVLKSFFSTLENQTLTMSCEEKVSFLEKLSLPYLLEIQQLDLTNHDQRKDLATASQDNKAKYALFKLIMMRFINNLKLAEKPLIWDFYCLSFNDNNAKLCPDQHREKLEWCINQLTENDSLAELDPLNVNSVVDELEMIANDVASMLNFDNLISDIETALQQHLEKNKVHHHAEKNTTPTYVYSKWQEHLSINKNLDKDEYKYAFSLMTKLYHSLIMANQYFIDKKRPSCSFIVAAIEELKVLYPQAQCLYSHWDKMKPFSFFKHENVSLPEDFNKLICQKLIDLTTIEQKQITPKF